MKHLKTLLTLALSAAILASCGTNEGTGESTTDGTSAETTATENTAYNSIGLTADGGFEGVTATDHVTLCEYKGITVPADECAVTDDEIEAEIESWLAQYADTVTVTDRAIEDGDTVNIDYVGSVDGIEFEGGSTGGQGTDVTIGVTSYIDDFLEQLIGHKPGETFDVEVTFPDPYTANLELSGEDAVFVTTINHITEQIPPELTDDFVKETYSAQYGWETVDDFREGVTAELRKVKIQEYVIPYLSENCTVEVPESVFDQQIDAMLAYYTVYAKQSGMNLAAYLNYFFAVNSEEQFIEQARPSVEEEAAKTLILLAIAETEGISASDDDIVALIKQNISTPYDDSLLATYTENFGIPYLKQLSLQDLSLRLVVESAVVE